MKILKETDSYLPPMRDAIEYIKYIRVHSPRWVEHNFDVRYTIAELRERQAMYDIGYMNGLLVGD